MGQRIHLITGKGGVGKSTMAAVLAMDLAKAGKRVLLVELGLVSEFSQLFNAPTNAPIGFEAREVLPNLHVSRWTGVDCLKEFLAYYLKVSKLVDLFFESKVMGALIRAAPALSELAILGKITSGPRGIGPPMDYDEMVVDAYSTGHCRALLMAPKGIGYVVSKGAAGRESRSILNVVFNPAIFSLYMVSTVEEMPVVEALETCQQLRKEHNLEPTVVLNRVYPNVENAVGSTVVSLEKESLSMRQREFLGDVRAHLSYKKEALKKFEAEGLKVIVSPMGFGESGRQRVDDLVGKIRWSSLVP